MGIFVAVLALVFQAFIPTASGMMSLPMGQSRANDSQPTFTVMCSVHGAMDPRDLGLTPADFGYDEWPAPSSQNQPNEFSCPVCQAHTLGQTVLPAPLFSLPQPSGAVQAVVFPIGVDRPHTHYAFEHAARGPPTAA